MGRPRTPTNVLEMRGAYKINPNRRRESEPVVVEPLGPCPEYFDEAQRKAWTDITSQAPRGVLTAADTTAVEIASRLLAKERAGENSDAGGCRLDRLLGRFGMNPADRSRVQVAIKPKSENPFGNID